MTSTMPLPAAGWAEANSYCDFDALNGVLRGEIAAVEAYDRVLPLFTGEAEDALAAIRDDHNRAVVALRDHILRHGGTPTRGSGPWGTFAAAVTRAARLAGRRAALSTLIRGEEHGVTEYRDALLDPEAADDCRGLIRSELLPNCARHLETLGRLIGELDAR